MAPSCFTDSAEARRAKKGSVTLGSLSLSQKIYQGVDAHGRHYFQPNLAVSYGIGFRKAIAYKELVALGLTEICCEMGKGKEQIYYFPVPEKREVMDLAALPPRPERDLAVYSFYRLPQLVYIPFVWAEDDKRVWREMDHATRLLVLNARSGGVAREDVVMPMDLVYDEIERKSLRINGYTAEGTGCRALLAIIPEAYVGWARQFRQDCQDFVFACEGFEDGKGAWWVRDVSALREACRMNDMEAVLTRLWDMYFEGEERSLVRFEDVVGGLIELHQNWVKVEQGH